MKKPFLHRGAKGFTLIELMVSLTILTLLALFSGQVYLNYVTASRELKAGNLVYEEARFLMEKIVREVRQNAVDYEEYFNRNVLSGGYNDNYCAYSSFFYDSGPDDDPTTFQDNESTGLRNPELMTTWGLVDPPAVNPIENELFLINLSGNLRTILTRITKTVEGVDIGKVAILKMVGKDFGEDHINSRDSYNGQAASEIDCKIDAGEGDGLVDTWLCDTGYPCIRDTGLANIDMGLCEGFTDTIVNDPLDANHSFVDISPNALNVVDLRFIVAPSDDPWKAYSINEVQIQPHITIQLTVEANRKLVTFNDFSGPPSITLTTTITARNYDGIKSDCR